MSSCPFLSKGSSNTPQPTPKIRDKPESVWLAAWPLPRAAGHLVIICTKSDLKRCAHTSFLVPAGQLGLSELAGSGSRQAPVNLTLARRKLQDQEK
jgi:hypothetical protein